MTRLGKTLSERIKTIYDPVRGTFSERYYEGCEDEIMGLARRLSPDQYYEIDGTNAPIFRLAVRTPDYDGSSSSSETTLTYELLGNDLTYSIYEHPTARALDSAILASVRRAVDSRSTKFYNEAGTDITSTVNGNGNAITLYNLAIKGTDSFIRSQYVFRVTQTVSNRSTARAGYANTNKLYTTGQLISETSPPSTLLFAIDQIPTPSDIPTGYVWRWLKKTPTVVQIGGNKFNIAVEYLLERWSTFLYGLA